MWKLFFWFWETFNNCKRNNWFDTDEGDIDLDSTVLVDDNITDYAVVDVQENDERARLYLYSSHMYRKSIIKAKCQ